MEVLTKTRKLGGSLIATIPKDAVKELGIKENEQIALEIKKPRKSFFGIIPGLKSFTEEDRFDRK